MKHNSLSKLKIISIAIGLTTIVVVVFALLFLSSYREPTLGGTPKFQFKIDSNQKNHLCSPLAVSSSEGNGYFFPLNKLMNFFKKNNEIIVANSGKNLVQAYDNQGNLLRSFSVDQGKSKKGSKRVYLKDISIDGTGKIYASTNLPYLLVFNPEGKFLNRFPPKSSDRHSILNNPTGSCFGNNRLYVIDGLEGKILEFDMSGNLLLKFGGRGSKAGRFRYPDSVAVKDNGDIIVTDSGNSRLQVFNSSGKLRSVIDNSEAPLIFPRGIAIDSWQNIHVVDTFNQRVLVFDDSGRYLYFYGSGEKGSGAQDFCYPNGITIDQKSGTIYIADVGNNRISVWDH